VRGAVMGMNLAGKMSPMMKMRMGVLADVELHFEEIQDYNIAI